MLNTQFYRVETTNVQNTYARNPIVQPTFVIVQKMRRPAVGEIFEFYGTHLLATFSNYRLIVRMFSIIL